MCIGVCILKVFQPGCFCRSSDLHTHYFSSSHVFFFLGIQPILDFGKLRDGEWAASLLWFWSPVRSEPLYHLPVFGTSRLWLCLEDPLCYNISGTRVWLIIYITQGQLLPIKVQFWTPELLLDYFLGLPKIFVLTNENFTAEWFE